MTDHTSPAAEPVVVTRHNPGFLGTGLPASIALIAAIFLFLLPFIDIKCNGMRVHDISGAELATGYRIKGFESDKTVFGQLENSDLTKGTVTTQGQKDVNVFATIALIVGVITTIISFLKIRNSIKLTIAGAIIAFAALVGLWVQITKQVKDETAGTGADVSTIVSVTFTAWFYLSAAAFLFAAILAYRRSRLV